AGRPNKNYGPQPLTRPTEQTNEDLSRFSPLSVVTATGQGRSDGPGRRVVFCRRDAPDPTCRPALVAGRYRSFWLAVLRAAAQSPDADHSWRRRSGRVQEPARHNGRQGGRHPLDRAKVLAQDAAS